MKRFISYLALVIVCSVAAAWYAATAWNSYRTRRDEAKAVADEKAESQRLAHAFAQLVRGCDEVVIVYRDEGGDKQLREIRFADPAWIKAVATIIEGAACVQRPPHPALWSIEPSIERPTVRFYKNKSEVLEMMGGGVLLGSPTPGEVALDKESAASIRKLIATKL